MLVPFFFKRYKGAFLATLVNWIGSFAMIIGVLAIASLFSGELETGEGIVAVAIFLIGGYLLTKLAEAMANKKQ